MLTKSQIEAAIKAAKTDSFSYYLHTLSKMQIEELETLYYVGSGAISRNMKFKNAYSYIEHDDAKENLLDKNTDIVARYLTRALKYAARQMVDGQLSAE